MAKYPPTVRLKLQAMRIGELGIAAIPCETFVGIALAIKKKSSLKPTFSIDRLSQGEFEFSTGGQHIRLPASQLPAPPWT